MPSMCDSDFYEPIEGLPSVMESHYTYYLWTPSSDSTTPDSKHKIISSLEEVKEILRLETYPQISIDRRIIELTEAKKLARSLWELGASDVFFWKGELRAYVSKGDI